MKTNKDGLAFDRASVRTVDQDGRLHVEVTNISKATVNPYRGSEIPEFESLGLDSDRVYFLLRDPQELEKAAATFNNIPLLNKHIPINADEPQKEFVVGSTGTDAAFVAPYLKNSLVVWVAEAIAGIETEQQKELSCAYRYRADMTPGTYEGMPYDGVMRDIRGNHVALVETGRAGPDVVVSDGDPFVNSMEHSTMKHSKTAIAVAAALRTYLRPKLAQDAKLGDLAPIVRGITAKNLESEKPRLINAIKGRTQGKLAQDADLADLAEVIDAFKDDPDTTIAGDDDVAQEPIAADDDLMNKLREMIAAKLGDEEANRIMTALNEPVAQDAPPDFNGKPKEPETVSKQAMDAALKKAATEAESAAVKRMQAVNVAEKEVRPLVGDVVAMDSAEAVYKFALDAKGVDTKDVHPSAYRSMVKLLIDQAGAPKAAHVAMDSAAEKQYADMFPNANRLIRS